MTRKKKDFNPSIHQEDRTKEFRLNAKHCFLTYPKYATDKQRVFDTVNNKYKVKKMLIATEHHENGDLHMHAYMEFDKKVDIRNWDVFDIDGHHCNIQAARKPIACVKYLEKEDQELFRYGTFEEFEEIELYELARNTPEEDYYEICRKSKGNHPS